MEPIYHPITARQLAAIKPDSASYIFAGNPGTGRRLAATAITRRLNCLTGGNDNCAICQNILSGSFADLSVVEGQSSIGMEQIQDLQQTLSQRPFSAETKRLIIIEADAGMTREAQNRLLKTLEEPPRQTIIIMITGDAGSFLPTVQSRCQIIQFLQPSAIQLKQYLSAMLGESLAASVEQLRPMSVGQALTFATHEEARISRKDELSFAHSFLAGSVFSRMVLSGQVKARVKAIELVNLMARLTTREQASLARFNALEQAHSRLLANVGPRVALEALALAL